MTRSISVPADVLIVSDDPGLHHHLGAELEARSLQVMDCPGPQSGAPCVGLKSETCPLRDAADVVVLDIHGDGPCYLDKSGRGRLPRFYGSAGKPVLILTDEDDATPNVPMAGVVRLSRMARAEAVVGEIEALITPTTAS